MNEGWHQLLVIDLHEVLEAAHTGELPPDLESVSNRLIPLVAHDRVGLAGGVLVGGLLIAAIGLFGEGRAARHAVTIAGLSGFGVAVAVHFAVGYTDLFHLAPAMIGTLVLFTGVALWTRETRTE